MSKRKYKKPDEAQNEAQTVGDVRKQIRASRHQLQISQGQVLRFISVLMVTFSSFAIDQFSSEGQILFFLRQSIKKLLYLCIRQRIFSIINQKNVVYVEKIKQHLQSFLDFYSVLDSVGRLEMVELLADSSDLHLILPELTLSFCRNAPSNKMNCHWRIQSELKQRISFIHDLIETYCSNHPDTVACSKSVLQVEARREYSVFLFLMDVLESLKTDYESLGYLDSHLAKYMCPVLQRIEDRLKRSAGQVTVTNHLRNIVGTLVEMAISFNSVEPLRKFPEFAPLITQENWEKHFSINGLIVEASCSRLLQISNALHDVHNNKDWSEVEQRVVSPSTETVFINKQDLLVTATSNLVLGLLFACLISYTLRRGKPRKQLEVIDVDGLEEELKSACDQQKSWQTWGDLANKGLYQVAPTVLISTFAMGMALPGLRAIQLATPIIMTFMALDWYFEKKQLARFKGYKSEQKEALESYFKGVVSSFFELDDIPDNESCRFELTVPKNIPDYVLDTLFSDPDIDSELSNFHNDGNPMYIVEVKKALTVDRINELVAKVNAEKGKFENIKKIKRYLVEKIKSCADLACYEIPGSFQFCLALSSAGDEFELEFKDGLSEINKKYRGLFFLGEYNKHVDLHLQELDFSEAGNVVKVKAAVTAFLEIYQKRPKKAPAAATFFREKTKFAADESDTADKSDADAAVPKVKKRGQAKPPVGEPTSSTPTESADDSSVTGVEVEKCGHSFFRIDFDSFDKLSLNDETKQKFKQTATSKAGKSEGFQGILFRRCKDKGGNIFDAYVKRLGVHGDERVLLKSRREGRYLIYFVKGTDDHGKHGDISYSVKAVGRSL